MVDEAGGRKVRWIAARAHTDDGSLGASVGAAGKAGEIAAGKGADLMLAGANDNLEHFDFRRTLTKGLKMIL